MYEELQMLSFEGVYLRTQGRLLLFTNDVTLNFEFNLKKRKIEK